MQPTETIDINSQTAGNRMPAMNRNIRNDFESCGNLEAVRRKYGFKSVVKVLEAIAHDVCKEDRRKSVRLQMSEPFGTTVRESRHSIHAVRKPAPELGRAA